MKVPSDMKTSKFWRLKAALNGTRKVSMHWQEYSCDKLVKSMLFQRNDMNTCIYERFSDNFGLVEQHGDDFLVCGPSSVLECMTNFSLEDNFEEDHTLPDRPSEVCIELPLRYHAGRRHPCDCGCFLSRQSEEKVLHEWRCVGNRSVLHCSSLVGDTSYCVAFSSCIGGKGDDKKLH